MINAECTWGEGPDIIMEFKDHGFILYEDPWNHPPPRGQFKHGCVSKGSCDLTAEEAEKLGYRLIEVAKQVRELEKSVIEYFDKERSKI